MSQPVERPANWISASFSPADESALAGEVSAAYQACPYQLLASKANNCLIPLIAGELSLIYIMKGMMLKGSPLTATDMP